MVLRELARCMLLALAAPVLSAAPVAASNPGWPGGGEIAAGPEAFQRGRGEVTAGFDRSRVRIPAQALIRSYRNHGYRLEVSGQQARIEVVVEPLRSVAPFPVIATSSTEGASRPGDEAEGSGGEQIVRLAQALVTGEHSQYGAVSRILSWVGRNIEYVLRRTDSQEPLAVLERRTGYCTGVARLTTALLSSVGVQAREVSGFVFGLPTGGDGYHRWVEVFYPDRGWVFSDPQVSHHYVAATYVRLASPVIDEAVVSDSALLERQDQVRAVDAYAYGSLGLRARANDDRRRAAALQVTVLPQSDLMPSDVTPSDVIAGSARSGVGGVAVLDGYGLERRSRVVDGAVDFVALGPGGYRLELLLDDGRRFAGRLQLRDRELGRLTLPRGADAVPSVARPQDRER